MSIRAIWLSTFMVTVVGLVLLGGVIQDSRHRQATPCIPNSRFVYDANVPDGTVMAPGEKFEKQWKLENPVGDNRCVWGDGYNVVWSKDENFAAPAGSILIPRTEPGKSVVIKIPMTAPSTPGGHKSGWILRTPDGVKFGDPFWAIVTVK